MKRVILTMLFALSFISCNKQKNKTYGIFTVSNDGITAKVEGTIVNKTLEDFKNVLLKFPNLKTLNLVDVLGSDVNDSKETDLALELGRLVYKNNINTHLVDNGFVAGGGTDLLASGKKVSVGKNPKIAVHSWGGGFDGNPNGRAWDIKDDENHIGHQKYLHYFQDIGFSKQKAKDFYFFTIRSAKEKNIYYMMTKSQINKYLIR